MAINLEPALKKKKKKKTSLPHGISHYRTNTSIWYTRLRSVASPTSPVRLKTTPIVVGVEMFARMLERFSQERVAEVLGGCWQVKVLAVMVSAGYGVGRLWCWVDVGRLWCWLGVGMVLLVTR